MKTLSPLRKVMGLVPHPQIFGLMYEQLECGHTIPIKKDIIGETNAVRRRCPKCRKEQESMKGEG